MNLEELDRSEETLIAQFRNHSLFTHAASLSDVDFRNVLLQRRFLSLAFTPVYDIAVEGVTHKAAKEIARDILREEYPSNGPSHRENLVHDLLILGVDRETILQAWPTLHTQRVIEQTFALVIPTEKLPVSHDLRFLTVLRFWGEVLVSEEYACLQPRMIGLGLTQDNSRFYWPHFAHDMKKTPLADAQSGHTHADRLAMVLQELLQSSEDIEACAQIAQASFEARYTFYDQFAAMRG